MCFLVDPSVLVQWPSGNRGGSAAPGKGPSLSEGACISRQNTKVAGRATITEEPGTLGLFSASSTCCPMRRAPSLHPLSRWGTEAQRGRVTCSGSQPRSTRACAWSPHRPLLGCTWQPSGDEMVPMPASLDPDSASRGQPRHPAPCWDVRPCGCHVGRRDTDSYLKLGWVACRHTESGVAPGVAGSEA